MQNYLVLALSLFFFYSPLFSQTDYYVSPTGDDNNSGMSSSTPFQSLERARDEIRGTNPTTAVTVWLMDGDYYLDNTFDLSAQDSGTETARITYRAINKHEAKVHLTKRIATSNLQNITDPALLARVNTAATGQIKALDLNALGVQNMDTWPDQFRAENQSLFRIYADDEAMQLSRYPNDSTMMMKRVLQNEPGIFEYRNDRTANWLEAVNDGLWLEGYWRVAWQYYSIKTASIDVANKTIHQAAAISLGIGDKYTRPEGNGMEPYIAVNLLEEIDLPGEWSINFNTDMLYIWVPDGTSELKILDQNNPIFKLQDVEYVSIIDLTFDYTLGNAVRIVNGYDNLVAGCDIKHCISDAVVVENGFSHDIVSNDIHDLGAGGILLSGGDRYTLTPANHTAVNNHIYEFGQIKVVYAPAIGIPGRYTENNVGMYVAHNKIHGTPHVGIEFCGNNNIFEYNEIYDICRVSNDMGAFYSWADWTSYGNIIRYNYVHDAEQAHGAYFDDGDSGDEVYNNVFQHIDVGVFIGGGHDVIARNNLAIDCEKAVHVDNRGVSRGYNLDNTTLVNRVLSVPYQEDPWSTQYPSIVNILEPDYPHEYPNGCEVDCNVAINTPTVVDINETTATDWGVTLGTNYVTTDATLSGATLEDIAAATGYDGAACIGTIPVAEMGLISDEYRNLNALATDWLEFSAQKQPEKVRLTWQTAREWDNKGFEIQRSRYLPHSGLLMAWEEIGFVESQGNSSAPRAYTFEDKKPLQGWNTYRLKQIDRNGNSSYSNLQVVDFKTTESEVLIYPNPVHHQLTIKVSDHATILRITLFDRIGRPVALDMQVNGTTDVSSLSAGLYFLEVEVDGVFVRRKVLVY